MSVFEDLNYTTEKATDIGERYIKASHQYFKLKIFQQLALGISTIAKLFAIGMFLFAGLVFMSVAASIEIGKALGSYPLGFLLIGSIYTFLTLLIYTLRGKLNTYILKKIGAKFFN